MEELRITEEEVLPKLPATDLDVEGLADVPADETRKKKTVNFKYFQISRDADEGGGAHLTLKTSWVWWLLRIP